MIRRYFPILLPIGIVFLVPAQAAAQNGEISGTVTETTSASPIPGVNVTLRKPDSTAIVAGTFTDLAGRYALPSLQGGTYLVSFSSVGYRKVADSTVRITGGSGIVLDAELEEVPLSMDAVIVSASRREEKAVSAPGSTSVIDAATVSAHPSVTPVDHLRSTGGIDIAQTGLMQQTVVARAFNNVFSTSLTMLTDNRIAAVPSLRANVPAFMPIVDDDIERIEVVRGPASALYGPNAHNGVVNFITRSPFASRGTTFSASGGNRSLTAGSVRHAGTIGERIGFKVSAQYFRGKDWEFADAAEDSARRKALAEGADPETLRTGLRERYVERFGGEGRMDFILGGDATLNFTAGMNQAVRTIELTDIGASQGRNWRYSYVQSRATVGSLFLQAFMNISDAGDSYILRTGAPVVDRSTMFVAQAQHRSEILDRERLTYGADLILTRPVTDGTITGRNENDDGIDEIGAYLQSETRLFPGMLDLVLAARADRNNRIEDVVYSPRAALVWTPSDGHNFRMTYNRAYSTPNTTELFLDIIGQKNAISNALGMPVPDGIDMDIRASGVPEGGYVFARDPDGRPLMHSGLSADRNAPMSVDDVALLWPALVEVLQGYGYDLSGVPAPGASDIRAVMGNMGMEGENLVITPVDDVYDVPRLLPTITRTVEFGYKGAAGEVLLAGIDVYNTHVTNFIGQFQRITPNVFMNGNDVRAYLEANGFSAVEASAYSAFISYIPLGTVTPEGVADPTAIIATPRNFGSLTLWGADLSLELAPSRSWRFLASFSGISRNFFGKLDGEADLSLNTPKRRGSFTVRYAHAEGAFHAEARARWMSGFRMMSGVYDGDVPEYTLFDLNAGAPLPWIPGTGATLSVLNVFDRRHREFVGAPEIGRLIVGNIHYTL